MAEELRGLRVPLLGYLGVKVVKVENNMVDLEVGLYDAKTGNKLASQPIRTLNAGNTLVMQGSPLVEWKVILKPPATLASVTERLTRILEDCDG